MARNGFDTIVACTFIALVVGCGAAEKQAAQTDAKPRAEVAGKEETAPPEIVDVEAKPIVAEEAKSQAPADAKTPARVQDPEVQPAGAEAPAKAPERRMVFFRLDANEAVVPKVVLSKAHEALCKVKVGDALPAMELPEVGSNQSQELADLYGKAATVVVFWKADRRMSHEALADLGPDVMELFGDNGVAVVGIVVNENAAGAKAALDKAEAKFVNLLDADGRTFAQVGSGRLPRVFLVDASGKILWFDIEYSQTTRRELHQALHAVTGAPPEAGAGADAKPQAVGGSS